MHVGVFASLIFFLSCLSRIVALLVRKKGA